MTCKDGHDCSCKDKPNHCSCNGTQTSCSCKCANFCIQSNFPGPAGANPQLELPSHLEDLYSRSTANLNEEEAQKVYLLLCEFADVFSEGPGDFGRADLVKHMIDTGDVAPIRQPPRRLPLNKKEEAQKAVQDMNQQGVIQPSQSALLRRKRDPSQTRSTLRRAHAAMRAPLSRDLAGNFKLLL